jgi:uncharacterized protein (TIGR00369 family)
MKAPKELMRKVFEEYITFNKYLGMKLLDVEEGHATALVPFRTELVGDPRIQAVHGGVISAAMDALGGLVGMTTLTSMEDKIVTIDMRIDYLRSARNTDLIIEASLVRSGNRIITTYMKAMRSDDKTLIAEGRAVYNVSRKSSKNI